MPSNVAISSAVSLAPAQGQPVAPAVSTSPASASSVSGLGTPIPLDQNGPWVIGEVLFIKDGKYSNDYTLAEMTRATKGSLYTKSDILEDIKKIEASGRFSQAVPGLYSLPTPVPSQLATIAISGQEVRLVYNLTEKSAASTTTPGSPATAQAPLHVSPPPPLSGVIFTPTAYRGHGQDESPGLGLDINAAYIIGRLYGKNSFQNSPAKTNYLDRVGVWMLTADGKMQLQSESRLRPAVAFGTQGTFLFRDTPQPTATNPNLSLTVNASNKSTQILSDAYFVMTKKIYFTRLSAGMMFGDFGDAIAQFSNFFNPPVLDAYTQRANLSVISHTIPFMNVIFLPTSQHPIELEMMNFNGAALHPMLINLKASHYLKMDFNLGYLRFDGGYDLLGIIAYRYNFWPR